MIESHSLKLYHVYHVHSLCPWILAMFLDWLLIGEVFQLVIWHPFS